tara:strand:+ start:2476 stop:2703 length:228 start_codon:yes stop_codon:yes gene_type:complete
MVGVGVGVDGEYIGDVVRLELEPDELEPDEVDPDELEPDGVEPDEVEPVLPQATNISNVISNVVTLYIWWDYITV